MPTPTPPEAPPSGAQVLAVLVAHDGAAWLPEVLASLAAQTARPGRVVGVDTGSTDGSTELLRAALGEDAVLSLPRDTSWPDAVAAALERAAELPWLWLLHDDAAPDPDCLARLLEEAARQPSAALLGPKAVDWSDPRVLVEVGVTTDRAGTRTTGLERREQDQGQHDTVRDVLAVGTAGLLARRERWDAVGGLDPLLPLFRDELDLGWRATAAGSRVLVVPAARVRHVRAATTGRRSPGAVRGSAVRVDRRHALLVLLAHASTRRLVGALPVLVVAQVLRALGRLLLRRPGAAADELAALAWVLGRPGRLRAARRRRAALRALPAGAVRPLLAPRTARLRARAEAVSGALARAVAPEPSGPPRPDPGGLEDGDDELPPGGPGVVRTLLSRPPVLLVLALALVALLAERAVLAPGGGLLSGGRLLPPPDGASDLWRTWTSSWSTVGVGTPAPAPPRTAVLGLLSTTLLGKPWLAVDLLLLASVPLAGTTAYLAARRVVASPVLRLWAAAVWALLPVATGAVAAGRTDAAVVQVALPLLGLAVAAVLRDDPRGQWHRAWGTGLLLAVASAVAPTLWLVAAPLLLVAGLGGLAGAPAASRARAGRRALAAAVVSAVPVVLLLPWPLEVLRTPGLLVHGPGRLAQDPALADPSLPAWALPLLSPGGAGVPPAWVTAGLLAAAFAGLLRSGDRRAASAGWTLALGGLLVALVLARVAVPAPAGGPALPVWPGLPLQVAGAGLLLAAVAAGDGARARLARRDFGWRQVLAGLTAVAAAVVPVAAAAAWVVRGADDPLRRGPVEVVPAFVAAELREQPGLRALVLAARAADEADVAYELVSGGGVRLGTADVPLADGQSDALDDVVADLVTARGSDAAAALSTRAVRWVVLAAREGGTPALADALDGQPGLVRAGDRLWRVQQPAAHLQVLPPELAEQARTARAPSSGAGEPLPSTATAARTTLPAGGQGRLLVLAEARDDGWRARLDGEPLAPATAWGWAQAFVLPAQGGELVVRHEGGRTAVVALQALAVGAVAVLAVPAAGRRRGLETDGPEQEARR